ncbi:hypothetical protein GCM10027612_10830 [Microbispora bryophytorum subsp. camponoti]
MQFYLQLGVFRDPGVRRAKQGLCAGRCVCHGARMAVLLGSKHRFAAEVGDWDGPALRLVDLWVAGQWLPVMTM